MYPAQLSAGRSYRRGCCVSAGLGEASNCTSCCWRLDPEDLREVIGAYHGVVAETVASFAGSVAKYMGDGVLVYFGFPRAHEDDAEQAVRAGLALVIAVGELEPRVGFGRVGWKPALRDVRCLRPGARTESCEPGGCYKKKELALRF